jgi:murein DD-endopeptidase MepM/ murein hydrolase activator NlpD
MVNKDTFNEYIDKRLKEHLQDNTGVLDSVAGGLLDMLMASNPFTILLNKNSKLSKEILTSVKGNASNATYNMGQALRKFAAGEKTNKEQKETPGTGDTEITSANIYLNAKQVLLKADKVLLVAGSMAHQGQNDPKLLQDNLIPRLTDRSLKTTNATTVSKAEVAAKETNMLLRKSVGGILKVVDAVNKFASPIAMAGMAATLLIGYLMGGRKGAGGAIDPNSNEKDPFGPSMSSDPIVSSNYYKRKYGGQAMPVSSPYGKSRQKADGSTYHHQGTDYALNKGTPIAAPFYGIITKKDAQGKNGTEGWGYYIIIDELNQDARALFKPGTNVKLGPEYQRALSYRTGRRVLFAHISKFSSAYEKGSVVGRGDIIAFSGGKPGDKGAGKSSGPHLHAEMRTGVSNQNNGQLVNIEDQSFGEYKGYRSFERSRMTKGWQNTGRNKLKDNEYVRKYEGISYSPGNPRTEASKVEQRMKDNSNAAKQLNKGRQLANSAMPNIKPILLPMPDNKSSGSVYQFGIGSEFGMNAASGTKLEGKY